MIPPTWNGLTDLTDRFFVANPDESDYVPFLENVEVLPELPLYAGIDYEGDPEQIDESAGRRFLPMQTLVEKPDDPTFYMRLPVASTRSSGWTRFQQANTVQYDVSVSPDNSRGPGFRIEVSGAPQHAIAGSIFNGNDADEPQAIYGGISYLTFLFTCALRGDRRPFHALPASVSSDVVRRRVITLEHPGLQHVHIAAATVVDITKEGDPVYSDGGVLRDPGPILQSLATLAYNQYVVPRYHVRVSTGRILGSLGPGSLLSVVNGVAANAVIRQIEISTPVAENHTPPPQRMTIVASTNDFTITGDNSGAPEYADPNIQGLDVGAVATYDKLLPPGDEAYRLELVAINGAQMTAWVDHDILIDDPDWPAASVDLIGDRPISVQPWGRMRYLDRTGRTIRQAESATAIAKSGRYPSTGPGAAWVARRRDLEEIGGIYASNIVGGGDLVWFHALSGMRVDFLKRQSPAVRAHQEAWIAHVGGRIGYDCHPAPARHIWHGDAKHRQYVTRDEILKDHHFDPDRHIEPDPNTGLLRWTSQAPNRLRQDVRTYFLGRREDG